MLYLPAPAIKMVRKPPRKIYTNSACSFAKENWCIIQKTTNRLSTIKSAANRVASPSMINKEQMPSEINENVKLNVEPTCNGSGKCCCICEKLLNFSIPCFAKRPNPIHRRSINNATSTFIGIKLNSRIFFMI